MAAPVSRVYEYVQDRRFVGDLEGANVGRSSLSGQAPHTSLYLRITDGIIREGRFQTSGCGFLLACCGAVIELCVGRSTGDCRSIGPEQIVNHLGGLPPTRLYCAELATAALQDALSVRQSPALASTEASQ
jgi:NifU-like protein involved in Fe-S cluster formation